MFRNQKILLFAMSAFIFAACGKDEQNTTNHLPVANYTVNTYRGDVNTVFQFDASLVSDLEDPTDVLEIRWDMNNSGVYDTPFSTVKFATHQYSQSGLYFPLMQVRDTKGMTDSIRKMVVVVTDLNNQPPELPIYLTPPNWQTWMEPTIIFKWTCSDPENDPLSFDLWIGRSLESMQPVQTGITTSEIVGQNTVFNTTISGFGLNRTFYWQVFARDIAGNYTPGHIWRFTTRPE
jgi:hypothetical protein